MHIDAADEVIARNRFHDVFVGDRHPLASGNPPLQLTSRYSCEFVVPAGLESNLVCFSINADCSSRKIAEWLATLFDSAEGETAFEASQSNKRQVQQCLLLRVGCPTNNQGVAPSHVAALAQ